MEDKINNEKRLATMEQKIDNLIESVDKIDSKLDKHVEWESRKYDDLNTKFSGKWVEKTLLIIIGVAATGIIGAIFKLIFK